MFGWLFGGGANNPEGIGICCELGEATEPWAGVNDVSDAGTARGTSSILTLLLDADEGVDDAGLFAFTGVCGASGGTGAAGGDVAGVL